jgi:hypothetical protein
LTTPAFRQNFHARQKIGPLQFFNPAVIAFPSWGVWVMLEKNKASDYGTFVEILRAGFALAEAKTAVKTHRKFSKKVTIGGESLLIEAGRGKVVVVFQQE